MFWPVAKEVLFKDISILVVHEEMSFKDISYLELWRPFCLAQPNHFFAILVEGIMRNISVRLYLIWISGSGGDVV